MKVLFVHRHFPGQFQLLAEHLAARPDVEIVAIRLHTVDGRDSEPMDNVRLMHFGTEIRADRPQTHLLFKNELFIREAASAAIQARALLEEGWVPDLIYSFTGWGSGLFLRELFPDAILIKYCEWYYTNSPETNEYLTGPRSVEARIVTSMLNIPIAADTIVSDWLIAPTEWQKSQFPATIANQISVIPDGINVDLVRPIGAETFEIGALSFKRSDRILTYVTRGADPFRGFKQFIEALEILQGQDPDVQALIVGDQLCYYGPGAGTDKHFRKVMANAKLDMARTHFLGRVDRDTLAKILDISTVHLYLTVPFVLSWSLLEALAMGCLVVGSDTAPVREFITHGENGLLADFRNPADIADKLRSALNERDAMAPLRKAARETILSRWNFAESLKQHDAYVRQKSLNRLHIA